MELGAVTTAQGAIRTWVTLCRLTLDLLVPKLCLGMHLDAKLCFVAAMGYGVGKPGLALSAALRPRQAHSRTEFANLLTRIFHIRSAGSRAAPSKRMSSSAF